MSLPGGDRAVVVMAKAPRPGRAKTRLSPLLGHQGCAALQAVLVHQAVATARSCAPEGTFLAVDPPDAVSDVAAGLSFEVHVLPQSGVNLGERMATATAEVLAAGHRPVVVIGTDVPLLRPSHLEEAFARLSAGSEVVFGPALDGGYYLVGLAGCHREVFSIDKANWGGSDVLSASVSAAKDAGLEVALLEALRDLDTAEDARALLACAELPAEVRDVLAGTHGASAPVTAPRP